MLDRAPRVLTLELASPRSQCCSSASSSVRQLFQTGTPIHPPPQEAMMQASRWPWVLWSQAVSRSASVFGGSQAITGYPGPHQSWEKFLGSSRKWGLSGRNLGGSESQGLY